jgi:hypothetical protein
MRNAMALLMLILFPGRSIAGTITCSASETGLQPPDIGIQSRDAFPK